MNKFDDLKQAEIELREKIWLSLGYTKLPCGCWNNKIDIFHRCPIFLKNNPNWRLQYAQTSSIWYNVPDTDELFQQ